jgi:hypothetical protein
MLSGSMLLSACVMVFVQVGNFHVVHTNFLKPFVFFKLAILITLWWYSHYFTFKNLCIWIQMCSHGTQCLAFFITFLQLLNVAWIHMFQYYEWNNNHMLSYDCKFSTYHSSLVQYHVTFFLPFLPFQIVKICLLFQNS